jgi:hypothetical protein
MSDKFGAQPVEGLTAEARAIISVIEWYKDNLDRGSPSDPWWTLDFKRRTVDGELMKPAKKGA